MQQASSLRVWSVLLLGSFCYSLGPNGYRAFTNSGLSPEIAVGFFLCIGAITLLPVWVRYSEKSIIDGIKHMTTWMWCVILIDGILTAAFYLLFIYAMDLGNIVEVSLLSRLSPVFVVFLAITILNEGGRIASWFKLVSAIILCLVGVLIASQDDIQTLGIEFNWLIGLGLLIALCDAARQTIIPLLQKQKVISNSGLTVLTMFIGGILTLSYTSFIHPSERYPVGQEYIGLILLGFVTVALPKWLKLTAYSMTETQIMVSVSTYAIIPFSGVVAWAWHGETVNLFFFTFACLCIITGLLLIQKVLPKK